MENNALLLENINEGLKTYSGRDACIRLVAYFFLFLYGILLLVEEYKTIFFNKTNDDYSFIFSYFRIQYISI